MKTLVVGSTGVLGSWVVDGLSAKGETVRCMSRSWKRLMDLPEHLERVAADLDRPGTLQEACSGVDAVFLLVPVNESETTQGLNAVKAAGEAGVKKIVYVSTFMPIGSERVPYFRNKIPVEHALMESGMKYTILRPNDYFQNDVPVIGVVTGFGIYPMPIGTIGMNRVDVRDVAECAVHAVTQEGRYEGKIYSLHGRDRVSGGAAAAVYSRYVGRPVRYAGNDLDYWERHVSKSTPQWLYRSLRSMYLHVQEYGMVAPREELEMQADLLGHPARTFDNFVRELSREWKRVLAWSYL